MGVPEPAFEPFRIKAVEPLGFTTRAEREAVLRAAGWELSRVPADKVLIDLLSGSDDSAAPAERGDAPARGDESSAGARGVHALERAVRGLTGLRHVLPAREGRAAERVLLRAAGDPEKVFFPVLDALDPAFAAPFKGDIDLRALEVKAREPGSRAAMIVMTLTNGSLGGQPASLANLRAAREISRRYKIPLFLDASRFAENAWFIKRREFGNGARSAADIARELFSCCDGTWMSAKKGAFAPIGGFLALNDGAWAARAKEEMILSGGLSERELEAFAAGLEEALDERWLSYRAASVERFAERLRRAGVPIVEPPGGHAAFVDAGRLLKHLPEASRPARALAAEIYLEGGVRAAPLAAPGREWVRLAVPRRAYTESHLAHAAAVVGAVAARAGSVRGLREPEAAA